MRSLLILMTAASLSLAQSTPLNIDVLVNLALKNSPDLNVSMLEFNQSRQQITASRGDYLPRLDATLFGGYIHLNSTTIKNDNTMLQGSLSASQLIYDFGKTGGAIDTAIYESNATFEQYRQQVSNKVYEVKSNYYNYLSAKNLIAVYEENLALTKQQLNRAERFFSAGIKTKIDVYDANVSVTQGQKELHDARYNLRLQNVALMKSIGRDSALPQGAILDITLDDEQMMQQLIAPPKSVEPLIEYAMQHRPEFLASKRQIDASKSTVREASSGYYPSLYAAAEYKRQQSSEQIEALLPTEQYTLGVNATWNLFEGFKTDATKEIANIALLKSESQLRQNKLALIAQTHDAYLNTLRSHERVALSNAVVKSAKAKFLQAKKRYENGLSDYIELQEARQGFINARAELVVDYFNYYIALANLDVTIGR